MKKMKEEVKRDRISEMPQEIKEQILSSLCMNDAISTISLSSVWRYSWVSLPFLDFGYDVYYQCTSFFGTLPTTHPKKQHLYSIFHEEEEVEDDSESTIGDTSDCEYKEWQIDKVGYLQMLDEFLQVYIEKNQSLRVLKKMSLYVPRLSNSKLRDYGADIVSRCLSIAKHNVTELDYRIDNFGWLHRPKDSYRALLNCLPILESKTLTKLELYGCYLATEKKVDVSIDLPNLKHLSLIMFNTDGNMLETLLAKCRALEKLKLSYCESFRVLRVPRVSKLRELEVTHIDDLDLIEINAMTLQSLTLVELKRNKCIVKMASNSCNNLIKLVVDGCGITDGFFNNVAEFPHLETLALIDCPKLKHIKITSNSLTRFDIQGCPNLSQTERDTPKLPFIRYYSSRENCIKRLFPNS